MATPEPETGRVDDEATLDEELAGLAQGGDADALLALLERYRRIMRYIAHRYFLPGADREDLLQEAALGMVKAVRDYRPERSSPFRPFAELCIRRQIITAVKTATRQKHVPLNSAVSLHQQLGVDDADRTLLDVLDDRSHRSPELLVTDREGLRDLLATIKAALSPYELQVLGAYMHGLTYDAIAGRLGTRAKSVDNALWRVKCKLRRRGVTVSGLSQADAVDRLLDRTAADIG